MNPQEGQSCSSGQWAGVGRDTVIGRSATFPLTVESSRL